MSFINKYKNGEIMTLIMILSDTIALGLSFAFSVWIRYIYAGKFHPMLYAKLIPALIIFYIFFSIRKLYPGILLSPPDELKRISQTVMLGFLTLAVMVFLSKQSNMYSRGIFVIALCTSLIAVPVFRVVFRHVACRLGIWGRPTIIFGAGRTGGIVAETLARKPSLGLTPVAFLDDDPHMIGTMHHGIPVKASLDHGPEMAAIHPNAIAVLALPGTDRSRLQTIVDSHASRFQRVILIPDLFGVTSLWVSTADLDGIVGLDIRHKLLDPKRQAAKRAMELSLIAVTLPVSLLLMALIAVAVKVDSDGPVLFKHKRIGFGGKEISIWKFRTMVQDAEARLQECLKDPELFSQWARQQKLPDDPRITRIGKFLRAMSLDELPQLFNVVQGDLSLVGPRPIVWAEAEKYKDGFSLYKKVKPGLTGLWQVSGRSNTSYAYRISLDKYYVRNWSVWMDIYIIAKTPLAVFSRRGAY
jgi:Undecaprenyl-phosphate galactose phosphotransferase WbaP